MTGYTTEDLSIMQGWSLQRKIQVTQTRIYEWYLHYGGKIYVAFSGGKDSTVLLDLARRVYPSIPAVFIDTGLEFPEIRDFVSGYNNVTWLKPAMPFNKIIEKYGYPVVSKAVSNSIARFRINPDEEWRYNKFIRGINKDGTKTIFKIPECWHDLALNAPFKISDKCCGYMKKRPVELYERQTGFHPVMGMMAVESVARRNHWLKTGCNAFDLKRPMSNPMGFWTEQDILLYLDTVNVPYATVYGKIIKDTTGELVTTGELRTGCLFCMFGITHDKMPNRFQRLAVLHPKLHHYCIHTLGCGRVLDYLDIPYMPNLTA